MSLDLTERARNAAAQVNKQPVIVMEIDGVTTLYGSTTIKRQWQIGDVINGTPVKIGDPGLLIGGLIDEGDQESYLMLDTDGKIDQQLLQERGGTGSVSNIKVKAVDKDGDLTSLITPGNVVEDIIGRRASVWVGFDNTSYPDDFTLAFKGAINDVESGPGFISFLVSHPDQKKRQNIFQHAATELNGSISDSDTTITVDDTTNFLVENTDTTFETYARINEEIIKYTGVSGSDLTGVTRGVLGTTAANHSDETDVESIWKIEGDMIDVALKMMLSGGGDYVDDLAVEQFTTSGAIFVDDLALEKGVTVGDLITITGATNGANNVTDAAITDITKDDGNRTVLHFADVVEELTTSATIDIKSKYDTLPDGCGMTPEDVDVFEHERLEELFSANFHSYLFYLTEDFEFKDFIEKELYLPSGCYAIPRKGKSSLQFNSPPLPLDTVRVLDDTNVKNPQNLRIKRGLAKYFYNHVVFAYEKSVIDGEFKRGVITRSQTSIDRIPVGNKIYEIQSQGMRQANQAQTKAAAISNRYLTRYRFGAESVTGVHVSLEAGLPMEVGDKVICGNNLKLSDITRGDRAFESRLFEIMNKSFDVKTGKIELTLLDTAFDKDARLGVIGPASKVNSSISTTQVSIKPSFGKDEFFNEARKWEDFIGSTLLVRKPDFSSSSEVTLSAVDTNLLFFSSALSFTPTEDDIVEFAPYDSQPTTAVGDQVKLIYVSLSDDENDFSDGGVFYQLV